MHNLEIGFGAAPLGIIFVYGKISVVARGGLEQDVICHLEYVQVVHLF